MSVTAHVFKGCLLGIQQGPWEIAQGKPLTFFSACLSSKSLKASGDHSNILFIDGSAAYLGNTEKTMKKTIFSNCTLHGEPPITYMHFYQLALAVWNSSHSLPLACYWLKVNRSGLFSWFQVTGGSGSALPVSYPTHQLAGSAETWEDEPHVKLLVRSPLLQSPPGQCKARAKPNINVETVHLPLTEGTAESHGRELAHWGRWRCEARSSVRHRVFMMCIPTTGCYRTYS